MTQAQKHFKNFFTKTYNEWSDHVFSYQVIRNYFLVVVKCRPSEMVAFHYQEEKCIKIMDVLFRDQRHMKLIVAQDRNIVEEHKQGQFF